MNRMEEQDQTVLQEDQFHQKQRDRQICLQPQVQENAASSGLSDAPIRWIVDDCQKFVEREIRRGNHYDAIIMDPPSYGRGPKGEIWKIEDAIHPLDAAFSFAQATMPFEAST